MDLLILRIQIFYSEGARGGGDKNQRGRLERIFEREIGNIASFYVFFVNFCARFKFVYLEKEKNEYIYLNIYI